MFVDKSTANAEKSRLISASRSGRELLIQRKLEIGAVNDPLEHEADAVADKVVRMPETPFLQRQGAGDEEEVLQKKEVTGDASGAPKSEAPPIVHDVLSSPGQALDTTTRTFMESRFGHDFSDVRLHTDAKAAESARAVNAQAYTVGRDVVFGNGQYAPHSPAGQRLMAHELTHVVQQSGSLFPQRMQRNTKVPMDFGEFETTMFKEFDKRGVEIRLKFSPDESKVDAKKIALSQSVRNITAKGQPYALSPSQASRMVARGQSEGYSIDTDSNNPVYGGRDLPGGTQDLKDTPISADPLYGLGIRPFVLGVHSNYELGYCYKANPKDSSKQKKPASLWDKPHGAGEPGESMMFETTALAIDGADKDKYYGSVKWGYKIEGKATAPSVTIMDITWASAEKPTANFMDSAKLWNKGKTPGTLNVTANPATVEYTSPLGGGRTDTLQKDTKIKQQGTGVWKGNPAIIAHLVGLAPSPQILFYINFSDVTDIGDGSPNKPLPL
jgi:hypothetical protein